MAESELREYSYTQNRELSWLRFNHRVLEEAADTTVPLLERLKFISIFTSNLDEFFMVRVGSLLDLSIASPEEIDNKSGMTPADELAKIYETVPSLIARKDELYDSLCEQLAAHDICDAAKCEQQASERKYINQFFKARVLPILSPQIVDGHHPFPHLENKKCYVAAHLRDQNNNASLGLIPVPDALPKFIQMPESRTHYMLIEDVILQRVSTLFGNYEVRSACVLCVTRNADVHFDEEKFDDNAEDLRSRMSKLLKKRTTLAIVRLEIRGEISNGFLRLLKRRIDVSKQQIFLNRTPLDMRYVYNLVSAIPQPVADSLQFDTYTPRWAEDLDIETSMIEQIQMRDRLLFFPFDSIDPFLRMLSEAAVRTDVISIQITIYRLAAASKIAQILCRAAENGKNITVLMELRARFDEENNIFWSRILEDAGCHVIYGTQDFKCHSKICLITLKSKESLHYITQIGTGNYNEKTSTAYTDLSLMTASAEIGKDAAMFFRNMQDRRLDGAYQILLVAPHGIKSGLLSLLDEEIKKGHDGYVCIKANSMTERQVIDKLVEASCAGVQIHLILRGICCIKPGILGETENIQITSIVGRYLEHARIYSFGRGENTKVLIGSSDLMTRNLNRRVEILTPVRDKHIRQMLLQILDIQLRDTSKACEMLPDGSYRRKCDSAVKRNSQMWFMEQSLHAQTSRQTADEKIDENYK